MSAQRHFQGTLVDAYFLGSCSLRNLPFRWLDILDRYLPLHKFKTKLSHGNKSDSGSEALVMSQRDEEYEYKDLKSRFGHSL